MSNNLTRAYQPQDNEEKIYRLWQKSGYFNPDKLPQRHKKPFCLTIAPPNITGSLHMGHALENILLDILIRWKRMNGYKTLWLPGTDHAGIATQNVVEKELKKQGLIRQQLGREKFLERVWQWREKYGGLILEQLKKLGCSCDWSRTRFTLDKNYQEAVKTAFEYYYKKGWIYQGKRVINWCPRCQTSLSDLELEHKEEKGYLWYIRYKFKSQNSKVKIKNFKFQIPNFKFQIPDHIVVATTRPETMLGDTAVAVNPKDKRYKNLIGEKVILPLVNREIPIIADSLVDPEFGTGAVKVTPAHDPTDFEISQKHQLSSVQVIAENGKMTKEAGPDFAGLTVAEARQKVIEKLKEQNLLEKIENYVHSVPHCYRCDSVIEPLISQQWFLKMEELAKKAISAVKNKKVKITPQRWEKVYLNWLKNIKDWCISRQLWWGHQIPIKGETDVLDTWFSSALWPFATLGWPQKTTDLKTFYPTDLISSARDILHLWITRMIFSGLEFTKKPPFKTAYIHATILTKQKKRMSKSLGTGIDPLELIEKYGSDAVRFGLTYQTMGVQEIVFNEEAILMGQRFANKIWNASRFVLQQIGDNDKFQISNIKIDTLEKLTPADKKIFEQLEKTTKAINADLEKFRFGQAAHLIYDFFWHDFCDQYIEASKKQNSQKTEQILAYVLFNSLKLLHPFMPFISEAIYQKLPLQQKNLLMIEEWPNDSN